jgi:hypothetical protein
VDSNSKTETAEPAVAETPALRGLEDRLPMWFRSTKTFAWLVALLLAFFTFLSARPLWHTDLWGHLAYGRLISESGFPVLWGEEPLMPLAKGIRFVDTAWLSQVIAYRMHRALGITALQFLFAAGVTLCLGMLAWRFYRRTHSGLLTALGLAGFLVIAWQQLFVNTPTFLRPSALIRPQIAGWVCFIAVFVCLTSRRWRPMYWGLIPAIFAVWANLHGSFLAGLMVLACFLVGRAIDIERRTRRIGMVFKDHGTRRYLLLLELAAVAVLLNPYGLEIYSAVLAVSGHPNMQGLIEWDALTLRSKQGTAMAFAGVVLMFLYRWSPRRVRSVEVLLLLGFGGLTLYYSRFMVWWAPVAAYYLVLHGNAVLKRDRARQPVSEPPALSSFSTVVCLVLLGISFALTPFGSRVLQNREADFAQSVGPLTPVRATEYLNLRARENRLPPGLIFNSYQWGDYLLWAGPEDLPVFVASHVQFVPEIIWQQYFEVVNLKPGYLHFLDLHGINLIVLSKSQHGDAIAQLQREGPWRTDYEDDRAVVLVRRSWI